MKDFLIVTGDASIQGSDAWHEMRRIKIGASNSPAILGISPYKDSVDVYEEMVLNKKGYINKAMTRGTELEPIARDFYNRKFGTDFSPAVTVSTKYEFLMASLDGLNSSEDVILEIKCPGKKVYDQCANYDIPKHWEYQIQHQFSVTGSKAAILLVWVDEDNYLVNFHTPIPAIMDEIVDCCRKFYYSSIVGATIPKPIDMDYEIRFDEEWDQLVKDYLEVKKSRISYESHEKLLHEQILLLSNGKQCKGSGVSVQKREVAGRVDYSLVEELQGVSLDQYRKPSRTEWRIFETKF